MLPRHIDVHTVRMHLAFGWSAQQVADAAGESVTLLIHHLAINGCPDLATRLANATKPQRRQHA